MVTLLLILMMACNLWILFYLTWERKEARKADNREDAGNAHQRPPDEIMGKSRFRMPETKPQTATPTPNAATQVQSGWIMPDFAFLCTTDAWNSRYVFGG